MSEPFTLVTYGSDEGVGSLLAQSEGENLIPVTFYQHALTEAQAGGGSGTKCRTSRWWVGHFFSQKHSLYMVLTGGSTAHFPEKQLVHGTKGFIFWVYNPKKTHFTSNFNFGNGF